jgi:DNA-binding transcriptional LysR family regulator
MPELKQLRVLRAIRDRGSFSGAADELDYTQPAVSKIVASLEGEIGAVLVDRETRPIRLTEAGEALARRADEVFERLLAAEAEVQAIAHLDSGTLSVGTFSSAGAAFFVDALRELRTSHPGVAVSIVEGMPSALVEQVRAGELDVAIVFDFPQAGEDRGAGLEAHHLLDDPFDVVLPAGHRLAALEQVTYADLADEIWVLPDFGPDSPSMKVISRGCTVAGFDPQLRFRVNDCDMILAMVAAGEGVSMLPRLMLPRHHGGIRTRPLADEAPVRRITTVRLPRRYLTPATERFLRLLETAAAPYATGASASPWRRRPPTAGHVRTRVSSAGQRGHRSAAR